MVGTWLQRSQRQPIQVTFSNLIHQQYRELCQIIEPHSFRLRLLHIDHQFLRDILPERGGFHMLEDLCLTASNYSEPLTLETLLDHDRFPRLHTLSIDRLHIRPLTQAPSPHTITDLSLYFVESRAGWRNMSSILPTCSNLVTLTLSLRGTLYRERFATHSPQILPRLKILNFQGQVDGVPVLGTLSTPALEELHFTIDAEQYHREVELSRSLSHVNSKPFTSIEVTGDALSERQILALLAAFPDLTAVTLSHMASIELLIQSLRSSRSVVPRLESLVLDTIGCFRNPGQQLNRALDLVKLIRSRATSADCSNITTLLFRNVRLYEGVRWPDKLAALDELHVDIQEKSAR